MNTTKDHLEVLTDTVQGLIVMLHKNRLIAAEDLLTLSDNLSESLQDIYNAENPLHSNEGDDPGA